jgi:hypothetical protein
LDFIGVALVLSLYIGTFILSSPIDPFLVICWTLIKLSYLMSVRLQCFFFHVYCIDIDVHGCMEVPLNSILFGVSFLRPLMLREIHLQRWMAYKVGLSPLILVIPCTLLRDISVGSF